MRTLNHFHPAEFPRRRRTESGIAMAVVLVVMVILTLFGIMLLVATDQNQLVGKNEREIATCRQAAEAAAREGISLAATAYNVATRFTPVITNCAGTVGSSCPANLSELSPATYVDKPGKAFDAGWSRKLFRGAGLGDPRSVYVTTYARNNLNEPLNGTPNLNSNCTVGTNVCDNDQDGSVVIIGEATMTTDGAQPLANYANVRVRKMIAAIIRMPGAGLARFCGDPHNQNSSYCSN